MADTNSTGSKRMVLLLIVGIPVTVVLVSTWLWYFVVRGDLDLIGILGTANRGELVQPPRQLGEQVLQDASGLSLDLADLEPRWAMVIPAVGGRCDEVCERSLYVTRQIHVAMGKEFTRLRRLYVSVESPHSTQLVARELSDGRPAPAAGEFVQFLAAEHGGLKAITLDSPAFSVLFPEYEADTSTWYVMDPAGWIMMSYNKDISYKDVIADLKFLLKNSGG